MMSLDTSTRLYPAILKLQGLLRKIDGFRFPVSSRQDVECILVRQATKVLDHALPWQQGHGRRTAALAVEIGKAAGLSCERLHHMELAAYLHDIGLLALPHSHEGCQMDAETYVVMQCHPRVGAELLEPFRFLREASVLIAHHHERWDGTGYPYGLRGLFIPIEARILAIADAFDAIDVPGADGPQIRTKVAYRILRVAAGTQFDRELIELFGCVLQQHNFDRTESLPLDRAHLTSIVERV